MKINYTNKEIAEICSGDLVQSANHESIHSIAYDTRKIHQGDHTLFICLKTQEHNGHDFIEDAYHKGVRAFLIDQVVVLKDFPEATFIRVDQVLSALQIWAKHHRLRFQIPVVAITGSAGKTTVKEWLYHLLSDRFVVSRSPKSFNSQLGVALSLFEIDATTQIALIEAGISQKEEMQPLAEMIQPTLGIFTSFGLAHRDGFETEIQHFDEKLLLFTNVEKIFAPENLKAEFKNTSNAVFSKTSKSYKDQNKFLIRLVAENMGLSEEEIESKMSSLPKIALRMESFEGIHDNLLLFDAYNWNLDGLEQALGYQKSIAGKKNRLLILPNNAFENLSENSFSELIARFSLKRVIANQENFIVFGTLEITDLLEVKNSVLLFKGAQTELIRLANRLKARNHSTFVEINLPALKNNLTVWKNRVPKSCQLLAMVKAQSYGAELTKISHFLEQQGISYLGVAYTDEGVELRKSGVQLPILVMNSDASSWQDCIRYQLEPSVYSFEQMEALVTELIHEGIDQFPVHLKFDTGMRRLGFMPGDLQKVVSFLKVQPEIKVKSVFSHLADADNLEDSTFTISQLKSFQHVSEMLQKSLAYPILRHILNSEGVSNYPEYSFDMVRLGIGMFGLSSNAKVQESLQPVLSWKSTISQIKKLEIGDSIGYGRTFTSEKKMTMAIIPVGYADGFKRMLSNGKGGVFIAGNYFPTVGRVCMDMLMIDCQSSDLHVGDEVEIIGENQAIETFAKSCHTIPYEIMTSLSLRMPRVFIEEVD